MKVISDSQLVTKAPKKDVKHNGHFVSLWAHYKWMILQTLGYALYLLNRRFLSHSVLRQGRKLFQQQSSQILDIGFARKSIKHGFQLLFIVTKLHVIQPWLHDYLGELKNSILYLSRGKLAFYAFQLEINNTWMIIVCEVIFVSTLKRRYF